MASLFGKCLMISLGELQKEQQNDKNQLVSELKNVDADTQRLRRDTDSQMHRKGLDIPYFDNANFLSSKLKLEVYKPNKNRTT